MRHHSDSDPRDALNDYLDTLAGAPPPDSRAGDLDPELRDGVDRFFDLAERAGMAPESTRRQTMNATLPASIPLAPPRRTTRRGPTLPAWTQHLHLLSTGLLIVAVIALLFAAFGPNGIRNGTGSDGPSLNGAVPIATVPDDAETSSLPYPGPDECTVEVTREEVIEDIRKANVATEPELQLYERSIEPTDEETEAILQTFREWQACGWDTQGYGLAYQMQLQTPWYTANHLPIFRGPNGENLRPVSGSTIEDYAGVLLNAPPADNANESVVTEVQIRQAEAEEARAANTAADANATPPPIHEAPSPELVSIPAGATPVAHKGGRAFPTIFAEDIVITGPNTATAQAYFVNERTGEVMLSTPLTYGFVKVDGQWLINDYHEGSRG